VAKMSFEVAATPDAPAQARASVHSIVGESASTNDILLATSELVSNAVIHGNLTPRDRILVDVEATSDLVRVTVTHDGPPFDHTASQPPGRPGGFGLHIVDAVSKRWDVSHQDGRTESWFEV
jgi:anti-sigma regulatory factor (Ser/Thr protein kinase)